jgi:hypothetical protein
MEYSRLANSPLLAIGILVLLVDITKRFPQTRPSRERLLYRYDPLDRDDWLAYRRTLGRPAWSIEAGISYYDSVARGEAGIVGDDYRSLTGREPLTIAEIIELKRAEMPLAHTVADRPA